MPTIQEKMARLEAARELAEDLVAKGVDLKSDEALPVGQELRHAFEALSQEFGYHVTKALVPRE